MWVKLVGGIGVSEEPAASIFRTEEEVGRGKTILINKIWTDARDSRNCQ
jgi:hypothetical protein